MLKKILVLITAIFVLSIAGSAMAYGGRHHGGRHHGGGQNYRQDCYYRQYNPEMGPRSGNTPYQQGAPRGARGGMGPAGWNIEVPQEIRDKMTEADKLRIDLRAEMYKPQIDRAKATEIWKKHRALRGEISEWFFAQRLELAASQARQVQPVTPPAPQQVQ